ncbi:MAG: glycosyltransferase [Clostridia bacterium]|nr:glycosyltransferase [Clostridia bacterium]
MTQKTVAILLAIYDPNIPWLVELLDSLNAQTYQPICLYVRDDASPHFTSEQLEGLLNKHITKFPYILHRNEKNLGSNKTFEALIRDSSEPYIAFCDQDDIWLPEKLANTVRLLESSPLSPVLVCADLRVIDGDGNVIAESMEQHRRRHVFMRGTGLAPTLIYRNFALGCTMVMERERALSYLPFPSEIVHDHYLAFRAANDGAIDFLDKPQMHYRVYGGNQTGVMTGVSDKTDYLKRRIQVFDDRVSRFSEVASFPELEEAKNWSRARLANFHREKGGFRALWRMRRVNFVTSVFELFALRFPLPVFRFAIRLVQKGFL